MIATTDRLSRPSPVRERPDEPDHAELVSVSRELMGGRVSIHLGLAEGAGGIEPGTPGHARDAGDARSIEDAARATAHATARAIAARALGRMSAWADRLTRFSATSELSVLNLDAHEEVVVRPTIGAVLAWAQDAAVLTCGVVDATLLDERLAAERRHEAGDPIAAGTASIGPRPYAADPSTPWSIRRGGRADVVTRPAGLHFDLDGIAKGWLADRALGLLRTYPTALVDADGDIAIRVAQGQRLAVGIAHPFEPLDVVASLTVDGGTGGERRTCVGNRPGADAEAAWAVRCGIATSGTSVHHWGSGRRASHHIIDPRTRRSAVTDVVQATVVAGSAREAEAWAKTAIVLGSQVALRTLDRDGLGLALVTERDELLATMPTLRWLA